MCFVKWIVLSFKSVSKQQRGVIRPLGYGTASAAYQHIRTLVCDLEPDEVALVSARCH